MSSTHYSTYNLGSSERTHRRICRTMDHMTTHRTAPSPTSSSVCATASMHITTDDEVENEADEANQEHADPPGEVMAAAAAFGILGDPVADTKPDNVQQNDNHENNAVCHTRGIYRSS
jgi:hypothetical protein